MTATASIFGRSANKATKPALVMCWDVDGVLVDSEALHRDKLIFVAKRYGVELNETHFNTDETFKIPDSNGGMKTVKMKLHGAGDKNIYWWLMAQPSTKTEKPSQQQWLDELLAYYETNAHTLKSRGDIIWQIRMMQFYCGLLGIDLVQGIVTSGTQKQLNANLKALKNKIKFDFMVSADDITEGKGKPSPDPYLAGIAKTKALPKLKDKDFIGVAVEDSETGVDSALAAGLACVHWPFRKTDPVKTSKIDQPPVLGARSSWQACWSIINYYHSQVRPRLAAN